MRTNRLIVRYFGAAIATTMALIYFLIGAEVFKISELSPDGEGIWSSGRRQG